MADKLRLQDQSSAKVCIDQLPPCSTQDPGLSDAIARVRAFGLARRRYKFTPELHAALRAAYSADNKKQLSENLKRLRVLRPSWPPHAWKLEAKRLGLTIFSRERWNAEDD